MKKAATKRKRVPTSSKRKRVTSASRQLPFTPAEKQRVLLDMSDLVHKTIASLDLFSQTQERMADALSAEALAFFADNDGLIQTIRLAPSTADVEAFAAQLRSVSAWLSVLGRPAE